MSQGCRIEDRMAAMDHMIVERQNHNRGIRDDPAENAGVHGIKVNRLGMNGLSQASDGLIRREDPSFLCARHTRPGD
jgi:hypothetical protein